MLFQHQKVYEFLVHLFLPILSNLKSCLYDVCCFLHHKISGCQLLEFAECSLLLWRKVEQRVHAND